MTTEIRNATQKYAILRLTYYSSTGEDADSAELRCRLKALYHSSVIHGVQIKKISIKKVTNEVT